MLGLSPREVILECLSKILSTAAWAGKGDKKKNGLLENQVCNFGAGVDWPLESYLVHSPPLTPLEAKLSD